MNLLIHVIMKSIFFCLILLFFLIKGVAQYTPKHLDSLQNVDTNFIKYNKSFSVNTNYHTLGWGFFCKKEWQLEKAIKIPFRFRLGSVEACDKLEGKRH